MTELAAGASHRSEGGHDAASAGAGSSRQSAAAAIGDLAVLPIFMPLVGKRAIIAGATERAVWKAELLHAAGAIVEVYAADPCSEMRELAAERTRLSLIDRVWRDDDLFGASIALVDTLDDEEAARFRSAARRAAAPVNAIDNPAFCDFQFGAILNRSPLVIGISTDGAAPVFGQAIRARLEALLPEALQAWAKAARAWRERIVPLHLPFHGRRRFWENFSRRALSSDTRAPEEADFAACLDETKPRTSGDGEVVLVGAGPGDPDLVTLKAVRALQGADVVLYDNLVAPEIVAMARREARRIDVGKRGYRPSCKQDDITALMVDLARDGKKVVRLKGGDPMIFGRANEEIEGCRAAGVAISVIPGVTAALGAAASLGTSLTERTVARRLQFITAHARDGKLPDDIDWRAICDPHAATVVYMGVRTMDALVEALLGHGIAPETPALLIERATLADEKRFASTIADMPATARAAAPDGPCLLMIGLVFARHTAADATRAPQMSEA